MKSKFINVCIDANVYISAIAFGGKPLKVVERALNRDFFLISCPQIIEETRRNLINKLGLDSKKVNTFLENIEEVASIYVPNGNVKFIEYTADNLVLEASVMGNADVLVTGDRKHLLPLIEIQGIKIEPPSKFLLRYG